MKFLATLEGRERVVELRNVPGNGPPSFLLDGQRLEADVAEVEAGVYSVLLDGRSYEVHVQEASSQPDLYDVYIGGRHFPVRVRDPRRLARQRGAVELEGRQKITAPMPGKVVRLLVAERQTVEAGQGLLVVEAMKMQNEIRSPKAGVVAEVQVSEGAAVTAGQTLLVVE